MILLYEGPYLYMMVFQAIDFESDYFWSIVDHQPVIFNALLG